MAREKSAQSPLSKRMLVNIQRDQTTATPRVIWAHEMPILEAIHGEGNVKEVNPEDLDEGYKPKFPASFSIHNRVEGIPPKPSESLGIGYVFIGDPGNEYDRMRACYGLRLLDSGQLGEPWVEYIYGRFLSGQFRTIVGAPTLEDVPPAQLRQLLKEYGYSVPVAGFDSTDAERKNAAQAERTFNALDKPSLVKLAQEYGVELA